MSKKGPKNDSSAKNDELLTLREEIDRVDLEILSLLNERAQLVKLVGGFKRKEGRSVYSFGRERDLISKLETLLLSVIVIIASLIVGAIGKFLAVFVPGNLSLCLLIYAS